MAGRRFVYGLAMTGCLIFYLAYQQWFSWIVLLFVVLLPWLSLALSLGAVIHTGMEPEAATRMPMGTRETVRLRLRSGKPIPPHMSRVRVTKPMTGEKWVLKPGDGLPTDHCGGLVAQLHKPRICDYLGLFSFRVRRTNSQTFYVLPEPVKMEVPPDLTRYLARRWRPKPGGGYAENHEIRQYHPGDSLNQIHWKLSAKAGELMLREPMEPERGLMLLTMDLRGTAAELDRKFGQLLWLGSWLTEQGIVFDVRVLTGCGIRCHTVRDSRDLDKCVENLLASPGAAEGSIRDRSFTAAWQHHIGGDVGEA